MRGRSGRRRTFGSRVVVALGIGALLALVVLRTRRRAAEEETSGEPRGTTTERFGEDRERQTRRDMSTTEPLSNALEAEVESTQEDDTQDLTEAVQQRGGEKADEVITQDIEGIHGSAGDKIRRAKDPVRLRPLKGRPLISVIRGSVKRK
jgi:cytoskeletal protein RodZ